MFVQSCVNWLYFGPNKSEFVHYKPCEKSEETKLNTGRITLGYGQHLLFVLVSVLLQFVCCDASQHAKRTKHSCLQEEVYMKLGQIEVGNPGGFFWIRLKANEVMFKISVKKQNKTPQAHFRNNACTSVLGFFLFSLP